MIYMYSPPSFLIFLTLPPTPSLKAKGGRELVVFQVTPLPLLIREGAGGRV
jgi:hypothetical protein